MYKCTEIKTEKEAQKNGTEDLNTLRALITNGDREKLSVDQYFVNFDLEGKKNNDDDQFESLDINDLFDGVEVIKYIDSFISEVINFEIFGKVTKNGKQYYVKFKVWDDESPNRWYNGIGDRHLDNTEMTIYIRGVYSQNYNRLKKIDEFDDNIKFTV